MKEYAIIIYFNILVIMFRNKYYLNFLKNIIFDISHDVSESIKYRTTMLSVLDDLYNFHEANSINNFQNNLLNTLFWKFMY